MLWFLVRDARVMCILYDIYTVAINRFIVENIYIISMFN